MGTVFRQERRGIQHCNRHSSCATREADSSHHATTDQSAIAEATLAAMEKLRQLGGEEIFKKLHHQQMTFRTHWNYCQTTVIKPNGNNNAILRRILITIEAFHKSHDWNDALRIALTEIPVHK
jgi:hypothetical protein